MNNLSPKINLEVQPELHMEPYPYLVIDDFIDQVFFDAALQEYDLVKEKIQYERHVPERFRKEDHIGHILRLGGRNDNTHKASFSEINEVAPLFGKLVNYTYSEEFAEYFIDIFKSNIIGIYGEKKKIRIKTNNYQVSFLDSRRYIDIYTSCVLTRYSNNVGLFAHTDRGDKVISVLLQFGFELKNEGSGGFSIYSNKTCPNLNCWSETRPLSLEEMKPLALHDEIPFKRNRVIAFLKTKDSWHAVTPTKNPINVYRDTLQININRCNQVDWFWTQYRNIKGITKNLFK